MLERVAQRSPRLQFVAIDIGEHMLAMARRNVIRAGVSARVPGRSYGASSTEYQTQMFSDSLRAALTVREVQALCAEVRLTRELSKRHESETCDSFDERLGREMRPDQTTTQRTFIGG